MTLKALFFDLDGTISDTDAIHLANWIELLRPHGIDVDMNLFTETLSSSTPAEAIDQVLPDISQEEKDRLLENEESGYRKRMSMTGAITGFDAFIEDARGRGISIVLVSKRPQRRSPQLAGGIEFAGGFQSDDLRRGRWRGETGPGSLQRGAGATGASRPKKL